MIYINQFFFDTFEQIRKIYLNSKIYDNKISKVDEKDFTINLALIYSHY